MKKLKIFVTFLTFLVAMGCSKDFLENPPLTTITDETYPETANDAYLVTNAAYNNLRNWWITGGYPLADIMSDDQTKGSEDGSNPDLQQFEDFTFNASQAYILSWYQTLFQSVRHANIVIDKLPAIPMDESLKSRYIAEAKFVRAYVYFMMVRLWGDVPLVTTLNPDRIVDRTAAAEIYNQLIIPDLEEAAGILPEKGGYPADETGRATRGAAKALLANVYLHLHDYENAEAYAEEVILSGQYSLDPDWARVFSLDGQWGPGSIFELGALPEGNNQGGNQYGNTQGVRGTPNWGWGFGRPSWDYINDFEADDPRMDASVIFLGEILDGVLIEGSDLTSDTTYDDSDHIIEVECYNQKVYVEGATDTQENWGHNRRIIRYADVLLIAAEAKNENGDQPKALEYLNMVRERARGGNEAILPDITETNQAALRMLIWEERRHELAFEQIRYFDLMRQGRMAEVLGPLGFTAGKNELLPIPQQEIDLSEGKLTQNPNWD
jgi:tetratricopeptide (TPR) repeat protein